MTSTDAHGHDIRVRLKYLLVMLAPVRELRLMGANLFASAVASILLIAASAPPKLTARPISRTIQSQAIAGGSDSSEISYNYKFENPRFYIRIIEVDLNSYGAGQLRFTRGESDEVLDCKIKLLPATISRIRELFEATGFLGADTDYQDKKHQFPHMGWITLGARQGANERKARFNYTTNVQIKELEEIFRGIASQEMALFDIENAERYQPLDLPKQLEILANDLGLDRITEPERLLTALNDIANDDTQALIARNQARKLIDAIRKGKFKSPAKKQ